MKPDPCTACGRPLVAAKSRRTGLCAGCHAQADSSPVEAGRVEHAEDCPGGRIVRRQSARRDLLICTECQRIAYQPRRTDWTEPEERR